ncbi:MAG: hypothetical protein WA191_05745 [Telluria sp.]|nr:hypothetical protein [Telluria sp.]
MMERWNYQHSSLYWSYRIGQFSKPRQSSPPSGHCPHILDSQARRLPYCIGISAMQGHPDSPFLIEKYFLAAEWRMFSAKNEMIEAGSSKSDSG